MYSYDVFFKFTNNASQLQLCILTHFTIVAIFRIGRFFDQLHVITSNITFCVIVVKASEFLCRVEMDRHDPGRFDGIDATLSMPRFP